MLQLTVENGAKLLPDGAQRHGRDREGRFLTAHLHKTGHSVPNAREELSLSLLSLICLYRPFSRHNKWMDKTDLTSLL